jgi:signal transduction histidine kinase
MIIERKKGSLIHDYLYYAVLVVFTLIVLSATLAFFTFQNIKEEREARYIHELNRICDELSESFRYLEKSAEYTADKIIQLPDSNRERIAYYLKKSTRFPRLKEDVFTWALFTFIDPNNMVIADSIRGVIDKPTKTADNLAWLKLSRERPGELHFSDPDYNLILGEETIKTGYGVLQNSNFIGTISVGFNVSRLNQKINNILSNSGIMFIFLDSNYRIITQSNYNQPIKNDNLIEKLKNERINEIESGELNRPIKYRGGFYTHFMKINNSPYIIVVGDRKVDLKGAFLKDFMPQILQTFSLIFLFLTLLYFFRQKVINPIVRLSEAADKISRGEEDVIIPETSTVEMQNLATQIEKVMSYTKELREAQRNLIDTQKSVENALEEVEKTKKAKETILANLAYGLKVPAHRVLNHAEYLVNNIAEKNPKNPLIKGWKEVANTARYIQTLVLDLLEYTRSDNDKIMLHESKINIVVTIKYIIDMVKMIASEKFIDINFKHGLNLPEVLADDLRIKQILTNYISSAILKSPQNAIILINCYFDEILSITIKDQRFTSEHQTDLQLNNPFISTEYNKDNAIMYSEEIAKNLAELHGCKVEQIQEKEGISIVIKFPKFRIIINK